MKMEKDPTDPEVPSPSGEVVGCFSKAVQTWMDAGQRPLCREVKQESEDDVIFGRDGRISETEGQSLGLLCAKPEHEEVEEESKHLKRKTDTQAEKETGWGGTSHAMQEQALKGNGHPCHNALLSPLRRHVPKCGFPNFKKSFDYKANLITHQRIQMGEKPYKCSVCEENFNQILSPRHWRCHMEESQYLCASHIGENPYGCAEPESVHKLSFNLQQPLKHPRIHKEKPTVGKSSYSLVRFRRPWQQRADENPHHCADCGKSFHYRSQLIRHQRMHTGEKPYHCADCGKCFSQRSHFIDHQRSHKGENPYRCSDCEKSFRYVSQLLIHQRSHTGEKPFPCLDCSRRFSRRAHLLRHQRNIHASILPALRLRLSESEQFVTRQAKLSTLGM